MKEFPIVDTHTWSRPEDMPRVLGVDTKYTIIKKKLRASISYTLSLQWVEDPDSEWQDIDIKELVELYYKALNTKGFDETKLFSSFNHIIFKTPLKAIYLDKSLERIVGYRAQAGSKDATNILITSNIKYALYLGIKDHRGLVKQGKLDYGELSSLCVEALLTALNGYKPELGARIWSLLKSAISRRVTEYLTDKKLVGMSPVKSKHTQGNEPYPVSLDELENSSDEEFRDWFNNSSQQDIYSQLPIDDPSKRYGGWDDVQKAIQTFLKWCKGKQVDIFRDWIAQLTSDRLEGYVNTEELTIKYDLCQARIDQVISKFKKRLAAYLRFYGYWPSSYPAYKVAHGGKLYVNEASLAADIKIPALTSTVKKHAKKNSVEVDSLLWEESKETLSKKEITPNKKKKLMVRLEIVSRIKKGADNGLLLVEDLRKVYTALRIKLVELHDRTKDHKEDFNPRRLHQISVDISTYSVQLGGIKKRSDRLRDQYALSYVCAQEKEIFKRIKYITDRLGQLRLELYSINEKVEKIAKVDDAQTQ